MLAGFFLGYVLIRVKLDSSLAPAAEERVRSDSIFIAVLKMMPPLLIFFLVMGLVMLGLATPTESAATGVIGAVVLALGYRKLSLNMIRESLIGATSVASLLLLVMCCAIMFSQLLAFTGAPRHLGELVVGLDLSAWAMLFIMLLLPFVLFMFLDPISLLMVLIPIYNPLLKIYGFDEIWFYTLILIVATVGGLTPPFGYTLFALKSAAPTIPMNVIFRSAWPFVWIILGLLVVLAILPQLVTFLPNLSKS
jgi:TRAP-type mannitol/chloroaromatic compound transport system permease large subunit